MRFSAVDPSVPSQTNGTFLAVGTNTGDVQIWDAHKCKLIRTMTGHRSRVGTLAWSTTMLSSVRHRSIMQRDVLTGTIYRNLGHKSEVCGLKWSYDDRELASGGNDNQLDLVGLSAERRLLCAYPNTKQPRLSLVPTPTRPPCLWWVPPMGAFAWNTTTNTPYNASTLARKSATRLVKKRQRNRPTHGYCKTNAAWRYPTMSKLPR